MSRLPPAAEQEPATTRTLLCERDGAGRTVSRVRRTVLPGGLRVLTEAMPGVRSAALGMWVGVGSRDEAPSLAGASHFLEHLLFKGTRRRSALDISVALDAVGGELNAFTTKEYTCFHARVLDENLPLAVDVVADMIAGSVLARGDVEAEREVILDEIAMHDDDPDDAVHTLVQRLLWANSRLGLPILGSTESVKALTRDQVARHYRRRYRPGNVVVAVAGNVDHATVVRWVRAAFTAAGFVRDDGTRPASPRTTKGAGPRTRSGVETLRRTTEQANLVLALPGIARTDRRRYALGVLNAVLGGGTSSRLFQEVRERRGLAYSVYSYTSSHADTGMLGVYAGCLPSRVDQVLAVCREELQAVACGGVTAAEVERGKGQLKGSTVLGLEDTDSRMSRVARAELLYGELPSLAQLLERIDAVTRDDVEALAAQLLSGTPALAVVGPFDGAERFRAALA
ncbi:MAG: insulinase family protein [Actinomycetota bacterium]|nr:insulinase family protein [Actinomycetota bacterium]